MPKRGRGAAAILIALVLCMIAHAALATMHTEVASPDLEMTAEAGYGGMITYGKAFPIRVKVINHGEDFEGTLGVNAYVDKKNYDRYETEVTLPKGSEREFVLAPTVYTRQETFTVEMTRDGETVCAVNAVPERAANPNAMLIGVLSTRPQNLNYLNIDRENDALNRFEMWQTVPLTPETFPEEEALMGSFAMLVTDDVDPETLTERQKALLESWLKKGRILLCGGGFTGRRAIEYFSGLTGLQATGYASSDTVIAGLERSIGRKESGTVRPVSLAEIEGGDPIARDDEGRGLIWRTEAGPGRIYTAAFDAGDADFNSDPLMHWFWQQTLINLDQGTYNSVLNSGSKETAAAVAYGIQSLPIPAQSRLVPGMLIAAGVLILGSVCWLILKKADRRQWMWAVLPLLALVATAAMALLAGSAETNRPLAVFSDNLVQNSSGTIRSYRAISAGVPDYGRHTFGTEGEKLQVNSYDYVDFEDEEDSTTSEPTILRTCYRTGGENAVSAESVTLWQTVELNCEAESGLQGHVEGSVWMEEDGLHGEITNGTDCRLKNGRLITTYGFASVPDLAPGETANLMLAHRTVSDPANPVYEDGGLYLQSAAGMYTAVYQALDADGTGFPEDSQKSLQSTMINSAVEQLRQEKMGRNYYTIVDTAQFVYCAEPAGLPVPQLNVDGKPVEKTVAMSLLTAEMKYLEIGRSGVVFRPAGTDLPVRMETDENNRPAGEYRTSGTSGSYHSLNETPTFRFDLESMKDVRLEKVQITMDAYYSRQAKVYILNARTGEWDEAGINQEIKNPEQYLDGEGKLYIQFRSDVQDQYADIPTPGILIEGRVK